MGIDCSLCTLDIASAQGKIIEEFTSLGDVFTQYTYLIELSGNLSTMTKEEQQTSILVDKCQSQVWLTMDVNDDGTVFLKADSDTLIVRSILWLLLLLLNNKTPEQIIEADIVFVNETDLRDAFSDSRLNGFQQICATIKDFARNI